MGKNVVEVRVFYPNLAEFGKTTWGNKVKLTDFRIAIQNTVVASVSFVSLYNTT